MQDYDKHVNPFAFMFFSKRPVALEWGGTHMFEHARLNSWHQRRFEVGDFSK